VYEQVAIKLALLHEAFVADAAGEGLVPGVHPLMVLEVRSLGEGSRADVAVEGRHPAGTTRMAPLPPRAFEHLLADSALVCKCVVREGYNVAPILHLVAALRSRVFRLRLKWWQFTWVRLLIRLITIIVIKKWMSNVSY
jgi:hypothetical protein